MFTNALHQGEVEVIEQGRWGRYNLIIWWRLSEHEEWFLLGELGDVAPADPS